MARPPSSEERGRGSSQARRRAGLARRSQRQPAWGRIYCPYNDEECRCGEFCITSVWSTPKNPGNHARALRRVVDNCTTHRKQKEADDGAKE
jgi:hypothetical protein